MPEDYTVQQGDCISSVAFERGFFWQTLWNDGGNASLKSLRKDPNVLKEDDVIHIPDLTLKYESGATEQTHTFKLKGVPAKFKIRVLKPPKPVPPPPNAAPASGDQLNVTDEDPDPPQPAPDQPWANAAYYLVLEGKVRTGKTDGNGCIKISIPPNAQNGTLVMERGTPDEMAFDLALGSLGPYDTPSGAKQRLSNLGYDCGDTDDSNSPGFAAALVAFQQENGISATGDFDDTTKNKLKKLHGS
jgi:N-acetylmuramoyl-L-alanine amidase